MVRVIVNSRSGAVRRQGRKAVDAALRAALARAGLRGAELTLASHGTLGRALAEAVARHGEIWVGGGDGTLRAAARLMAGTGKVLGVLPLGTMNLLARDLGVPLDLDEAVMALAEAPVSAIDVGRINDDLFLNKSALGLYPEMIIDRERRRRLFGYGKWPAMLRAAWRALRRHRLMEVTIAIDGQRRIVTSPAVVVATSAYEFRAARLFHRPDLNSGRLTVYISHERDWLGSLGQLIKMFLGTLHLDPEMEILSADHLEIDFRKSRPVANDGEVEFIRGPVRYAVAKGALAVRHPARAAAVPAAAGTTLGEPS